MHLNDLAQYTAILCAMTHADPQNHDPHSSSPEHPPKRQKLSHDDDMPPLENMDESEKLLSPENLSKAFTKLHSLIQEKNVEDAKRIASNESFDAFSDADNAILQFLDEYDYLLFAQEPGTLQTVVHCLIKECSMEGCTEVLEGQAPVFTYNAIVKKLIGECGAPWNFVDKDEVSLGDLLLERQNTELYSYLVEHGVRTELIIRALNLNSKNSLANIINAKDEEIDHDAFLKQKLVFKDGLLLDEDGNGVMMGWERPLMEIHAALLCQRWADRDPGAEDAPTTYSVLNIGFGLGIVDSELQKYAPTRHVIIEAHPDVYAKMIEDGWDKRPGVEILFGKWQDFVDQLQGFDGVFFDTFGEDYDALKEFNEHLPAMLNPEGLYSFFNGLAARNAFFHEVSRQVAELDLQDLGLSTTYHVLDMELDDSEWAETRDKYWKLKEYWLPLCTFVQNA